MIIKILQELLQRTIARIGEKAGLFRIALRTCEKPAGNRRRARFDALGKT
jgi:hypothetical protein